MPNLVEYDPVVLKKMLKMWKISRQTDRQVESRTTDKMWSEKKSLGFQLRWAKHAVQCPSLEAYLVFLHIYHSVRNPDLPMIWLHTRPASSVTGCRHFTGSTYIQCRKCRLLISQANTAYMEYLHKQYNTLSRYWRFLSTVASSCIMVFAPVHLL